MNQGNFHTKFHKHFIWVLVLIMRSWQEVPTDDGDEDTWVSPFSLLFLFPSRLKACVNQSMTLLLAKVDLYQQSCEKNG
jgi:hypothetical protein